MKRLIITILTAMFIFTSGPGIGTAAEIHVFPGDSIQAAVNIADRNDTIIVEPGIYVENIEITRATGSVLMSASGNPDDTIIISSNTGRDVIYSNSGTGLIIKGFTISGATTDRSGVYLLNCTDCMIENNKFLNDSLGVYIRSSVNTTICNNTATKTSGIGTGRGINIERSESTTVSKNMISDHRFGIYCLGSQRNTISDNSISQSANDSIVLENSNISTLENNFARSNARYGIYLSGSSSDILKGNTVSNGTNGIYLVRSPENTISDNALGFGSQHNIMLDSSSNNSVTGNTISDSQYGIAARYSHNNSLTGNNAYNNTVGLYITQTSSKNTVSDNKVNSNRGSGISFYRVNDNIVENNEVNSNTNYGIILDNSSNNKVLNNNASQNARGIYIGSLSGRNMLSGNNVNSNRNDGIVLENTLENNLTNNIANSNNRYGIYAINSNNSYLANNTAQYNKRGISLSGSVNNTVSKNIVTDCSESGLFLTGSSNNILSKNIACSSWTGISLEASQNNEISGNNVSSNGNGVYMSPGSAGNRVYDNYFNNINNANVKNNINSWNITKTPGKNIMGGQNLGGNFWGRPDGIGHSQVTSDADGDGITDFPYIEISGNVTDHLPLAPVSDPFESIRPVANFSANVTGGYAPLSVQFNDSSENANTISWDFNSDSVADSEERDPVHEYRVPGNYTVSLTASNENGTDSKLATIAVLEKLSSAIDWEFFPQEPVSGDIISIKGNTFPGENIDAFVTFEKTVPVSKGKFEYILEDVKIPEGFNNLFTVEARGAKNLNVRVKMVIWVTKSSEASGDTATVSQSNVPPGTYKIKIDGNAAEEVSEVNLKITALKRITASSSGEFSYSYNTAAIPPGDFEIKVGNITRKVTIKPENAGKLPLVLPVSDFDANITQGYAPLTVQFNDSSQNMTGWNWDFGDGVNSTEQNPIHIYNVTGNYTVNLTAINGNGTDSKLATINVATLDVIPPQSISGIQSLPESTWINWTWINPEDLDFNHTEVYLNSIFQANTSAEYFNSTDLEPEKNYTISMHTADIYGNVNETWVNASAITSSLPDISQPGIESVTLFPANTTAGSKIDIGANITDNIGVVEVTAGDVRLTEIEGVWKGSITAPSSAGKYSVSIKAKDATGNTANTSVAYNIVQREGSVNIEVLPTANRAVAGKSTALAIEVKNTQNVDDSFKVRIRSNGLPASYQARPSWFNWTEEIVTLRAGQEVVIPIEVKVPARIVTGLRLFRVSVNSEKFPVHGSDTGYLLISRSRHPHK